MKTIILYGKWKGQICQYTWEKKELDRVLLLSRFNVLCESCLHPCNYSNSYYGYDNYLEYKGKEYCAEFDNKNSISAIKTIEIIASPTMRIRVKKK